MSIFGNKKKKAAEKANKERVVEAAKAFAKSLADHIEKHKVNVQIDVEETVVNGNPMTKHYRVCVGERDNLLLEPNEYHALLSAMIERLDNDELLHLIWQHHEKKHADAGFDSEISGIMEMLKGRGFEVEIGRPEEK